MPTIASPKKISVRKGQVWMDGDVRKRGNRVLEVLRVRRNERMVVLKNQKTGRETEASLHRFNNYRNGYVFLQQPAALSA